MITPNLSAVEALRNAGYEICSAESCGMVEFWIEQKEPYDPMVCLPIYANSQEEAAKHFIVELGLEHHTDETTL